VPNALIRKNVRRLITQDVLSLRPLPCISLHTGSYYTYHDAPLGGVAVEIRRRQPPGTTAAAAVTLVTRRFLRRHMAVLVRYAPQPLPGRPHVRLGENENGVIAPEDAHDVEGEGGGVAAGQHRAPVYQLGFHRGELFQQLQAPVQQRLYQSQESLCEMKLP
jgi:hypothetical protein